MRHRRPLHPTARRELLADLAALGVPPEHLLDRAIDVAADGGLVRPTLKIEQLPARNAGGYQRRQRASGRSKSGAG